MSNPEGERDDLIITGKFVVTHNLTDKRGITVERYITNRDTKGTINASVDESMDVLDRQFIRADIMTKEAQLANMAANLNLVSNGYEEIIAKRDAAGKLSTMEKEKLKKYDSDVRGIRQAIEYTESAVAVAKKKLEE